MITETGEKLIRIILFIIGGQLVQKMISLVVKRLKLASQKLGRKTSLEQQQRLKTMRSLIKNSSKLVINFIVLVMIISELGVDIVPLLAGAGIVGLAVGFGAKSLVADLITGFFIILENQFNVGDKVELGKNLGRGKVVKISLRTIILKDKEKKTYIIPNSSIKFVVKFPKKK